MKFLIIVTFFFVKLCSPSIASNNIVPGEKNNYSNNEVQDTLKKIIKSDAQWKSELSEQEYYVLRQAGTERAYSGDLLDNKAEGVYVCRGCKLELFDSKTKFESRTGWPSFYEPVNGTHVEENTDYKIGYARTEILCARCGGHLGHVFNDGPKPTGLRYCVNSVSLDFVGNKGE